jgi:hypothetical protein
VQRPEQVDVMKRFIITNTILSRAEGATPSDVTWYRGENPVQALAALAQAFAHGEDAEESNLPESMKYDVIAVRMDMHVVPDPEPYDGPDLTTFVPDK